jgi:hypothetical protein
MSHYPFTVNCNPGFLSCSPRVESRLDEFRAGQGWVKPQGDIIAE